MTTVISGDTGVSQVQAGSINQDDLAANVVGKGPIFSAYASAATPIGAAGATKVNFQTKEFDPDNGYDTSTSRYTPAVAGYYQVISKVRADISSNGVLSASIVRSGVGVKEGPFVAATSGQAGAGVSAYVYMNGTTDYLEITVYSQLAGNTLTGFNATYFQAALVRAA